VVWGCLSPDMQLSFITGEYITDDFCFLYYQLDVFSRIYRTVIFFFTIDHITITILPVLVSMKRNHQVE